MIKNKVISILANISNIDEQITEEQQLSTLGISSLEKVEVIISLEDEFSIRFKDSDLTPQNLETVKSIIELVEKHMGVRC
ncbi:MULTISPECIES: acyl carrier protein [Blautia]|uniref:acyl carrier protein n=1 Tax=Blautia TaxID=572511 RepID=UPI000BA37A95|nr:MULTISPECIES: phosphopantetheine-binding protein [Blautia]